MKDTKVKSDQKRNSATMLMTEGKIWKQLLVFAVPLILGNLLQQMYNAVDSIIVGNYVGSNALAAVGSSNALINLLIAFAQGASVTFVYLVNGREKATPSGCTGQSTRQPPSPYC